MVDFSLATEIADILAKRHGFENGLIGVAPDALLLMIWNDASAIVEYLESEGYLVVESNNG